MLSHIKTFLGLAKRNSPSQTGGETADSIGFSGKYTSWDSALADSIGYGSEVILETPRQAALKVKKGEAVFEREAVIFDKIECSFPILAALLGAGAENGGRLSALDFGGALCGSCFQCRDFLKALSPLRRSVVEQPAHVACGRAEFQDDVLRFYYTVDECLEQERPDVLLLSCVLQYLQNPHPLLSDLVKKGIPEAVKGA